MKDVNVLAVELIGKSKDLINSAKELKNGFSFSKLMVLAKEAAKVVEDYTKEIGELSSDTKLALGIEILVNAVDVPYVPQWVERKIYQIVLNKAVKYLNGPFGWKIALDKVPATFIPKEDGIPNVFEEAEKKLAVKAYRAANKETTKETNKKAKIREIQTKQKTGQVTLG